MNNVDMVHDDRSVRLVSFTKVDPEYADEKNLSRDIFLEDLIAFCARVSNPNNQSNTETSSKLIKYLIKNKHWSPFEMASACLEINTTRDIARQILRHRSFSFQEFSQRYADPTQDMEFCLREARLQDPKNRQNSIEIDDESLHADWKTFQQEICKISQTAYNWALEKGIAKEVARSVLPEGLMMSRLYVNGTIRSWIHYIEVRTDPSTQKEHRIIAENCAMTLAKVITIMSQNIG